MSTYKQSLFPDYYFFENGRSEVQAAYIVERLRDVDLAVFVDGSASSVNAERRNVVARLKNRGVQSVMQMVALSEGDVRKMGGLGPVFIDMLRRMQQEALMNPEKIIELWETKFRTFVLPDDLGGCVKDSMDFFGNIWAEPSAVAEESTKYSAMPSQRVATLDEDIVMLEKCVVEALRILEKRWEAAAILKSFFVDGMPMGTIKSRYSVSSDEVLRYLLQHRFLRLFLNGESLYGVRLSETIVQKIPSISAALCYAPATTLNALTIILPQRFLLIFGLSLLRRTATDVYWAEDYIVRSGEVQRCRYTLRCLMQVLQTKVMGCREKTLKKLMYELSKQHGGGRLSDHRIIHQGFFHHLLGCHRWIEEDSHGYRLSSELIATEIVRIARIVYDAKAPITTADIVKRYENMYMETPKALNYTKVHQRFPRIRNISRGIWRYK